MRIHQLHLQDFRGFASFVLELHPELTLLVGRNGSGKTGVLEGLAVALGAWFGGMSAADVRSYDRTIQKRDARLTRLDSSGLPTLEASYPVRVQAEATVAGQRISWLRELRHSEGRTTHGEARQIRDLASQIEARLANADERVELPVIGYYAAGRLWVQKRDRQRGSLNSRLDGYSAALEIASDPKLFEAWMAWRETERIQRIAQASDAGQDISAISSPHLEAVQEAARTCLEGAKRIYFSVNYQELRVEFDDNTELPFDRLSDGQRSLVAMAADIAWRCAQLNPFHGREAARETGGVVLIDEIELHLHPAWQRRVLADLRRAFPKIQFVATTHSPQVIGAAQREWIRILVPGEDRAFEAGHVEGRDTNSILADGVLRGGPAGNVLICDSARGMKLLHINPATSPVPPEKVFGFGRLGNIVPVGDSAAADCRTLNLNCTRLVDERRAVVTDLQKKLRVDDSPRAIRRLIATASTPTDRGLPPYSRVAVEYLQGKLRTRES